MGFLSFFYKIVEEGKTKKKGLSIFSPVQGRRKWGFFFFKKKKKDREDGEI